MEASGTSPGGGGGGGGGGRSDAAKLAFSCLKRYEDVVWERDARGAKVELGSGASGIVYAGTLCGQPVAIKEEEDVAAEEEWLAAVRLHFLAACPHIVRVHGAVIDRDRDRGTHYFLVMERLAGSLTALVLEPGAVHGGADVRTRLLWLGDVAGALAYLHADGVIHADVKPDNVLLTARTERAPIPVAKLADFGMSVQRHDASGAGDAHRRERGTPLYMDPALLDGSAAISLASDVYSFGVMAWHVLTGRLPYAGLYAAAGWPANAEGAIEALIAHVCGASGGRPPVAALVERGVPPDVVAVVAACWVPAPAARPAIAAVKRALEAAAAKAGAAGGAGVSAAPYAYAHTVLLPPVRAPRAAPSRAPVPTPAPAPAMRAPLPGAGAVAARPWVGGKYVWRGRAVLGGHRSLVLSLVLLPDGRLASGDTSGSVRLWDPARSGAAVCALTGHDGMVTALAVLADGWLAASTSRDLNRRGGVILWDTAATPPAHDASVDFGCGVDALAALVGGRLAAGCADGTVRVLDVAARAVATLEGHSNAVTALVVLADGRLASGSADTTVRVWELAHDECDAVLTGHTGIVRALAALPDGRLASGSEDKTVRLWEEGTLTCIAVFAGHTSSVLALVALPGGRLASGSFATIRLWDPHAGTGACAILSGHTSYVNALAVLPGRRLASASWDKAVRLWELPLPPPPRA